MSFSSSNSESSSRLPSFGSGGGGNNQQHDNARRARSPLASSVKRGSRSKSRNRLFRPSGNNDDYFSSINPNSGTGYHSPPILEDDDELKDVLADQPLLPSFRNLSSPSTPNQHNSRRKAIEDEMDNDAKDVFSNDFLRDDNNSELVVSELDTPIRTTFQQTQDNDTASAKLLPKVKFYNSSDDETTEEEDEDISKSKQNSDEGSSGTLGNNNNNSKREGDEDEDQTETFKERFRKKMNFVFNEDEDIPDVPGEENFLNRIMKLGDIGGLAPGASKAAPERQLDEEEQVGFDGNSIPLHELGPDLIDAEAKGIMKDHFYHNRDASGSTFNFYNPNPEFNLRDDLDDFNGGGLDGDDDDIVRAPQRVQAGVLSSLLKMYQNPAMSQSSQTLRSDDESILSGLSSPKIPGKSDLDSKALKSKLKKIGSHVRNASQSSIGGFHSDDETYYAPSRGKVDRIKSAASISNLLHPNAAKNQKGNKKLLDGEIDNMPSFQSTRPKPNRKKKIMKSKREATKLKITVHIAGILQKQRFILRMCKALMLYGAPTHRLEEYMMMTARVLEIDGQFIYFPGVMVVSFGDAATRTSEVQVVRCAQGLDLSKLYDVHKVYKAVVHDLMGVEEASIKIDELLTRKPLYPPWVCVFLYGFGSAMVTSWGFRGGWKDLPISFGIGLCVGFLQFYVAPRSSLYSNVFEVTSSIVVSFLGRALGTINNGNTFCFGGIVQGSLALILPGYIILCGSLELQSRNMVAGSVRMFYAIIYSLFLGFGITLGAALYGWIDKSATSDTTCSDKIQLSPWFRFLFVPGFAIALGLINQARVAQLPAMIIIAGLGYVVTYFAGKHFSSATEFTASMGAFVIGILGNLYSRVGRGMAVSAMLPAIFVQVPSGIASQSSLLSGVQTADNIVNNSTSSSSTDGSSLSFGVTMVEVAIGISVGLFAAAIVVYPLGKKRTGLFTL